MNIPCNLPALSLDDVRSGGGTPSGNSLVLVQTDDWERNGHGGRSLYRQWELYINGVLFRELREHSQDTGWSTGKYMDEDIDNILALLEECLRCKAVRCRKKDRVVLIRERKKR